MNKYKVVRKDGTEIEVKGYNATLTNGEFICLESDKAYSYGTYTKTPDTAACISDTDYFVKVGAV